MPDPETALDRPGNHTTHGLYTRVVVIAGGERIEDWLAFHDDVLNSLDPIGALEANLASRAAALCWRLRRTPIAEAESIERRIARFRDDSAGCDAMLAASQAKAAVRFYATAHRPQPIGDTPDPASIERIVRMEAHLNRQLMHTLHELEALQARRRGERIPLARVDVHGLPGA